MSRTRRSLHAIRGIFKHPRGRRQAIVNGVRPGAVPPDEWEDNFKGQEAFLPYRIARRVKREGAGIEYAAGVLRRNCGLTGGEMQKVLRSVYR